MRAIFLAALTVSAACSGAAGPPGATGSAGAAASLEVGAGLSGNGTAAQPLSVAFAGSGAAPNAARADHAHGAGEITAGSLGPGVILDASSVVGTVATAAHAASATDADSLGGLGAASYLTTSALAPYLTVAAGDARFQPRGSYATATDLVAYARLTDVPVLSSGKIAASVLPASVPLLDGGGLLPASVLPVRAGPTDGFVASAQPPASPAVGAAYYDTTSERVSYWNGASWIPVGLPAVLQFSPQVYANTLAVGAPFTVQLRNLGGEAASTPVFWTSPGFSFVASGCAAIAPGASCTVQLQVDAGASGARTGILVASGGSGAVLGIQVSVP